MGTEFEQKSIFIHLGIFQSVSVTFSRWNVCIYSIFPIPCLHLLVSIQLPVAAERILFFLETKVKLKQAHARSVLHQERVLKAGKLWGSSPWASVPLPPVKNPVKPQTHTYHSHTGTALSLHCKYFKSIILSWYRNKNRAWLGMEWKRFLISTCRVKLPKALECLCSVRMRFSRYLDIYLSSKTLQLIHFSENIYISTFFFLMQMFINECDCCTRMQKLCHPSQPQQTNQPKQMECKCIWTWT